MTDLNNQITVNGCSTELARSQAPQPSSLTSQFFMQSTRSYITERFQRLLQSENFLQELQGLSKGLVPEILTLLRKNMIANPEKLIYELVDEQLAKLSKTASENSKLNRECKATFKIFLSLEKLYLTEETSRSMVMSSNNGAIEDFQLQKHSLESSTNCQQNRESKFIIWEKRQLKAMSKLRKELLKTLRDLQLYFDIKVSMIEDEEVVEANNLTPKMTVNELESFSDFVSIVVIQPFGARLFQPLHDIATELELSEALFDELQQLKAETHRRHSRKPATPSKNLRTFTAQQQPCNNKKTFAESILYERDMGIESHPQENSGLLAAPSTQKRSQPVRRESSQAMQGSSAIELNVQAQQQSSTTTNKFSLGSRRNKRLLIQNSDLPAVSLDLNHQNHREQENSNQNINNNQFLNINQGNKRARFSTTTDQILLQSDIGSGQSLLQQSYQDKITRNERQTCQEISNESHAEINLCDIVSSFQSNGSMPIQNNVIATKRPLITDEVSYLKPQHAGHSSMTFTDTAKLRHASAAQHPQQQGRAGIAAKHSSHGNNATGPGFSSQRTFSVGLQQQAQKSKVGEQYQYRIQKRQTSKTYTRRIGGGQSMPQIKTTKPTLNRMTSIVSGTSSSINLVKKQTTSQQSGTMNSFLKRRQQKNQTLTVQSTQQSFACSQPMNTTTNANNIHSSSQQSSVAGAQLLQQPSPGLNLSKHSLSGVTTSKTASSKAAKGAVTLTLTDLDILGI